jgi:hypothetical protein
MLIFLMGLAGLCSLQITAWGDQNIVVNGWRERRQTASPLLVDFLVRHTKTHRLVLILAHLEVTVSMGIK